MSVVSGVIHWADGTGRACKNCGTEFGGAKTKLTVPPGTRVVSTGMGDVAYQSWFMPDNDVPVVGEECSDILAGGEGQHGEPTD